MENFWQVMNSNLCLEKPVEFYLLIVMFIYLFSNDILQRYY